MGQLWGQGRNHLETNENKNTTIQNLWDWESNSKREIHSIISLSKKKKEKAQINNLNSHERNLKKNKQSPKEVEKKRK